MELKLCGSSYEADRPFGVCDTGKLHNNLIPSLSLDYRFGNAEFIDSVSDNLKRLINCVFLYLPHSCGIKAVAEDIITGGSYFLQCVISFSDDLFDFVSIVCVIKGDVDSAFIIHLYITEINRFSGKLFSDFYRKTFKPAFNGFVGIHAEDDVHTALKVQSEFHALAVRQNGNDSPDRYNQNDDPSGPCFH